ncbi:MAG: addiction module protein [Desulfobacterales bacterium]|nr:addiction module protein [Desulfobacterales bacterium]
MPIEERALLVDSLPRSINPLNKENDQKWACEAKRRLEELRSGKVKSIPGAEVFKKIWKQFDK